MRNKLDITIISLLLGLMMAAGLTIADGLLCCNNSFATVQDYTEVEYHDASQFESQEHCYTHITTRRRCSSSMQRHSAGKSHSRQYISKASNSTSTKEHLLLNYSIRHNRSIVPQSLDYGNTIIVRLHRLLI